MSSWRPARAPGRTGRDALLLAASLALAQLAAACASESAVSPVGAVTIAITPSEPVIALSESVRLTATVDGMRDTTGAVHWSSSDPAIASVSAAGLVAGHAVGTARIAASVRGSSAETTVRVAPARVARVEIAAASGTLTVGDTTLLEVSAYAAGGALLTGRSVTFASTPPTTVAVIDGARAVALAPGTARVVATVEGVSASVEIVVRASPVARLELLPDSLELAVGARSRLVAVARDRAGVVLTDRTVTFASSAPGVATVAADGMVTAVAPGVARITASAEGVTAGSTIVVPSPTAAQLTVNPATATLQLAESLRLVAELRDRDGALLTGRPVAWRSTNSGVASVAADGVVTAQGVGVAVITATSEGLSASAGITVVRAPVATITVTPSSLTLATGQSGQLAATALDARGRPVAGATVAWTSSAPAIATVSTSGLVTAVAPGSAVVTASSEGKSATARVTVDPPPVAKVEVTPTTLSLEVGKSGQLQAVARDASGAASGAPIGWASSDASVASVSADGLVLGVKAGSATVTATAGGISGSASVTVKAAPAVPPGPGAPARVEIVSGEGQRGAPKELLAERLVVRVTDARGTAVPGVAVTWAADDGGQVAPDGPTTAADGTSSASWRLGKKSGEQTATALVQGVGTVTFHATSVKP